MRHFLEHDPACDLKLDDGDAVALAAEWEAAVETGGVAEWQILRFALLKLGHSASKMPGFAKKAPEKTERAKQKERTKEECARAVVLFLQARCEDRDKLRRHMQEFSTVCPEIEDT